MMILRNHMCILSSSSMFSLFWGLADHQQKVPQTSITLYMQTKMLRKLSREIVPCNTFCADKPRAGVCDPAAILPLHRGLNLF